LGDCQVECDEENRKESGTDDAQRLRSESEMEWARRSIWRATRILASSHQQASFEREQDAQSANFCRCEISVLG